MDLNDWGALGGCKGLGKLDLNTQLLRVPTEWNGLELDIEAYHLLFAHESSHWIRFHASTVGVSLSLMKYASERLIRDFVFALDERERHALVSAKKTNSNVFSFQSSFKGASAELSKTRQFWLDLRYTYKALLDSDGIEAQKWDTVPAIASAFTDVNFWARRIFAETSGIDHIQLDGSRGIRLINVDGTRITTRLLFECAATIDQYTSWLGGIRATPKGGYGARLLREAERALGGSYGSPLRAYEGITGMGRDRLSESVFNVALLIDFALNPKIPPFTAAGDVGPLHWEQIYPPFRYVAACEAVREIGPLATFPSPGDIHTFMEKICLVTRLPNPQTYGGIFAQPNRRFDTEGIFAFREATEGSKYNVGDLDLDYITFLAWVQRRFWRLRATSPELISLYGYDCNKQSRAAVSLLFGDEGDGWFLPPFHWSDEDKFVHGKGVSSNTAMQYISSVAAFTAVHDAVSNTHGIRKGLFPSDLRGSPFWSEIETMLREALSPDIW